MKKIIQKELKSECYKCNGTGSFGYYGNDHELDICDVCEGTGWYKENHYYFTDNKICFDADTLK